MCGVLINCIFIINTFKSELIGVLLHGNILKELNLTGLGYLFLENNNLLGEISGGSTFGKLLPRIVGHQQQPLF